MIVEIPNQDANQIVINVSEMQFYAHIFSSPLTEDLIL